MSGLVYYLIADDSIPCEAREHGCAKSIGEEIFFLAPLAAIVIFVGLAYIDLRWKRGPVAWFRRWRRRRAEAKAERERWTLPGR